MNRDMDVNGMSVQDLRSLCKRLLGQHPASKVTLSKLARLFIERRHARAGTCEATLRRYDDTARFLIQRLGDRLIETYSRDELERALLSAETLKGMHASWATRRYRVRAARSMWRFACANGYLLSDPCAAISVEGHDPQRLPVELEIKTLRKILYVARSDHTRPWFADACTLLALTCLRPAELWRLEWRYVELNGHDRSRLLLDGEIRRKNPTPALYPLCTQAVEILEGWHARTLLVVGSEHMPKAPVLWSRIEDVGKLARLRTGTVTMLFTRLVRGIGARCLRGEIPTLYTLRHFYQQLFEGCANPDVRMRLMGHSTPDVGPRHYMSAMEEEQRVVTSTFPRLLQA